MRLIISIYGGVPEAFEVFHCRATTTEEELRLFLSPQRATKRPFQYLILEVNRLPYPLQEVRVGGAGAGLGEKGWGMAVGERVGYLWSEERVCFNVVPLKPLSSSL